MRYVDIMSRQIFIPFKPIMISAIAEGRKSATSRTYKLGEIGDFFYIRGKCYVITSIVKMLLGEVAAKYYKEEGVSSPEEFVALWIHIHPTRGFNPEQLVFIHFFKEKYGGESK